MTRVSTDDLEFAATWLEQYEGQDDDNNPIAERVAAWLRAEVRRRQENATVRAVVARTGAAPARARAAVRRATTTGPNGPVVRRAYPDTVSVQASDTDRE